MSSDQPTGRGRNAKHDPSTDDKLCGFYGHRNKRREPCSAYVIKGTRNCANHAGTTLAKAKAKGAIVTELMSWGIDGFVDLANPEEIMLRLLTQSAARVELYSRLLQQAYEASERLAAAERMPADPGSLLAAETARLDLERVLNHGGVAALIGHTYAGTQTSGVIATGEKIRGLTELEGQERDRCMKFAATAKAAGLAERQIRLSEQLAATVAASLERSLVRLGHDVRDPLVRAAVAEELVALAGPKTIDGQVAT